MTKTTKTYQQLKEELDAVMVKLRHEDTDVDQALALHKEGKDLIKQLEVYLKEVSKKVDPKNK